MADQYTHNFKFEINGSFIRGECEFNDDGEASFKFICPDDGIGTSQPLPFPVIEHFTELMVLIKHIYDERKIKEKDVEIKTILIEKKEE